jgi:DNA-binding CsgD family transcriptional regulator
MLPVVDPIALHVESPPLARFSLGGTECIIIAVESGHATQGGTLGTFVVDGRCYAIIGGQDEPATGPDLVELLTPRELEIALLIAAGHETKSIARRLRISFHTVRVHLGRIYAKLGLHKQTELAARIAARFRDVPSPPLVPRG